MECIQIHNGESTKSEDTIPDILSKALEVSFATSLGHSLIDDLEKRAALYLKSENVISSGHDCLDDVLNGGFARKSLSMFLAGTSVGKSMILCDIASRMIRDKKNVLYITLEMSETRIASNILGISVNDIRSKNNTLSENIDRLSQLKNSVTGQLEIKEYPTGEANASIIESLLKEYKIKGFAPDSLFVDYAGLMSSYKLPKGKYPDYLILKSITEELRAIAIKYNLALISAGQTKRDAYGGQNVELTDVAGSWDSNATCDVIATARKDDISGKLIISIKKNRDGLSGVSIAMTPDYERMTLNGDSKDAEIIKKLSTKSVSSVINYFSY